MTELQALCRSRLAEGVPCWIASLPDYLVAGLKDKGLKDKDLKDKDLKNKDLKDKDNSWTRRQQFYI